MNLVRKLAAVTGLATAVIVLSACAPEIGSDEWCDTLKEKPKTDWTAGEAGDYTKYCVLGIAEPGSEEWCEKMKGKSNDDMTVEEAKTYAKNCLIK